MVEKTIRGRYQLGELIGQGGLGAIYRAHDTVLDRDIAVKVLSRPGLDVKNRDRLLREAQQVAQLNHPNIVTIFDAGEEDDTPFIVMELVEGKSLHEEPPSGISQILEVARQICSALAHAHQHGIIHRDLKPENVLMTGAGTVKLMDFGLAVSVASRISTETGITGTVFYLPPEQALGQPVDGRTDLYSLGVMLYEMTTGQLPFSGDDPLSVISQHLYAPVVPPRLRNPHIPPDLNALILQLMSKLPDDRPASASSVLQTLERMQSRQTPARALTPAALAQAQGLGEGEEFLTLITRGRIVARERELAEARQLWAKTTAGEAQMLLVSGEPGIGKTRLVRELITLAEVMGGTTLVGECYAQGSASYDPFAQMFRQILSGPDGRALDLPPFVLADLITLAPDLRLHFPDAPANPRLDPQAEQQRLFANVLYFFQALCQDAPLLVVLEDIHWADQGTLSLLHQLVRRSHKQRIMIVATYREVELDETVPLQDLLAALSHERLARRLKLTRLDRQGTEALLEALLGEKIPPAFLDSIYRETEGNPFFIEEVCKALMESDRLVYADGCWQYPSEDWLQVPQSVRIALQSRLSRLPPDQQEILRLAAIFGREFDFEALTRASGADDEALIDALERAERAQLVEETGSQRGGSFRFVHALIPATLMEGISGLRRRKLHRQVAEVLETLRPEDAESLAYQYSQAELPEKALHYLSEAGNRARQRYANGDAIHYYTVALEYSEADPQQRFQILAERAAVYDLVAQREAQAADFQAMQVLAESLGDPALLFRIWIAWADYYLATDFSRAKEPAEKAYALAQESGEPRRQAQALYRMAWIAWHANDFRASAEKLKTALGLLKQAGYLPGRITCLHMLALNLANLGELEPARQAAEEAIQLSREVKDRRQEATGTRRLAIIISRQGKLDEALQLYQAALAMHREVGDRAEECHALNAMAECLSRMGKPDEASQIFREALELADEIGMEVGMELICPNYLEIHYRSRGDHEGGLRFIESRIEKARQNQTRRHLITMLRYKAQILADLGDYRSAIETNTQALQHIVKEKDERMEIDATGWQARYLALAGDFPEANRLIQGCLERIDPCEEPDASVEAIDTCFNASYIAYLQTERGLWEQGLKRLEAAETFWRRIQAEEALAYNLDLKARLQLVLGQTEPALTSAQEAIRFAASTIAFGVGKEQFFFTCYRALCALGRMDEAHEMLERAYQELMRVADQLRDEKLRQSWVENVGYNREIIKAVSSKL